MSYLKSLEFNDDQISKFYHLTRTQKGQAYYLPAFGLYFNILNEYEIDPSTMADYLIYEALINQINITNLSVDFDNDFSILLDVDIQATNTKFNIENPAITLGQL